MLQYCPDRWIFKPIQNSYVIWKPCEQRSRENWRNNLLIIRHLIYMNTKEMLEEMMNPSLRHKFWKSINLDKVILQMDTKKIFLHIMRKKLQSNFLRSLLTVLWFGAHYPTDHSRCRSHQRNGYYASNMVSMKYRDIFWRNSKLQCPHTQFSLNFSVGRKPGMAATEKL